VNPDLDLKSLANVHDPFPVYCWLRDHEPVHWSDTFHGWVVTRYDDVQEIFRRTELFSSDRFRRVDPRTVSERLEVRAVADVLADWLVFRDPPDHTRLRALLQRSFTPRQLEKNRPRIQSTIDELLGAVGERGEMDFIRDFAFPLPALVIALLLGVPAEDLEPIKRWSDRLAAYLGGAVDGRDNFGEASAGIASLVDYFERLLKGKLASPGDDLMSLMLRAEHEGDRLSPEEVVSNCVLLLFAGHETTTNLLGNGLLHLLQQPAQLVAWREDPRIAEGAVEELLRFDGPVPATTKVVLHDTSWRGVPLARGQLVLPFLSSANRDPRQFENADALDLRRAPNRHLAFAFGIHFCLGAPLARLEARLAFDSLLRRFRGLSLVDPEPHWKPMIFLRGLESLALRWDS
jgi:cytochrome P450